MTALITWPMAFAPVQLRSEILTFSWACAAVAAKETTIAAASAATGAASVFAYLMQCFSVCHGLTGSPGTGLGSR